MQIFYFQIAGTNENVVYFWGTRYVSPYTSRPSTRDLFGQRSDLFARQLFNFPKLQFDCTHCTEVRFSSFFSVGFATMVVINPPETKLGKRTSVHCGALAHNNLLSSLNCF